MTDVATKAIGKPSENHRKTIGTWWLNGIYWMFYPLVMTNIIYGLSMDHLWIIYGVSMDKMEIERKF